MNNKLHFKSINPFNAQLLKEFDNFDITQLDGVLEASFQHGTLWATEDFSYRQTKIKQLGSCILENKFELAHLIVSEMGKPIKQAIMEIEKCVRCCFFYALHGHVLLQKITQPNVHFKPLGTILGIMPWNYPLWQIVRFCVPVLLMGNAVVVKPATNTPQVALRFNELVQRVLGKKAPYTTCLFSVPDIQAVISHSLVHGVSITGSSRAGKQVASLAGQYLKKCILELGGNDPFIVCEDARLDNAVDIACQSRLQNNGQTCIAAKRFLVHKNKYNEFCERICERLKTLKIGNPESTDINIGPQARLDLKQHLTQQVKSSLQQGAKCLFSVEIDKKWDGGFFYPPTVLQIQDTKNIAMKEELFGPVFSMYSVESDGHALEVANNSPYGLGATIVTSQQQRADWLKQRLQFANISINQKLSSAVHRPFGGSKGSGFGRELGLFGLLEFCNVQSVCGRIT